MVVTGGTHAGEFLRLLGNGHEYGIDRLAYGYQERPGGIAEALGLAERFVGGDRVCVMLADNVFERSIKPAVDELRAAGARRAHRPRARGRRRPPPPSRRAGVRRRRRRQANRREAGVAAERVRGDRHLLLRLRRVRRHQDARAVGPRRARDHRREQPLRLARARWSTTSSRASGATQASRSTSTTRSTTSCARNGANKRMTVPVTRIPLQRFADDRGWFMELMRSSLLPKPVRQSNVVFSRKGVIRGLHYHERGQDDLFVCLQGTVRVVALDRESGETFTEDIGEDNPVAIYVPGTLRARLRSADRLPLSLPRDRGVRPRLAGRARPLLGRRARQAPVEHAAARSSRSATEPRTRVRLILKRAHNRRRRPARRRARRGVSRRGRADARRVGHHAASAASHRRARVRTSCCTPQAGRTSTAPRTIRRARRP